MRKPTVIYASLLSVLGFVVGIGACVHYFSAWNAAEEAVPLLILGILLLVCRCMPLYVRQDCSIDMSFICLLAINLIKGPLAAAVVSFLTAPFVVIPSEDGKKRSHIFNTPLIKTLFNTANLLLTVVAAGAMHYVAGGRAGAIGLPGALWPMLVYILTTIVVNSTIMITLLSLEIDMPFYPNILGMFAQLLPSMACAAPIGYFMAYLMNTPAGVYTAALFMFPLILARYSFKLFLDGKKQQIAMIQTLTDVIEAKDPYTQGHSQRVCDYAVAIAKEMRLPLKQIETLRLAALFHDIGKVGVAESILCKPGPLTESEWLVMREHPRIGMNLLRNTHYFEQVKEMVLHHHECYNGAGYPDQTAGDKNSLDAYILSAADAFDAMTSDRPYRKSLSLQQAKDIIREERGKQFHPDVAAALLGMLEGDRLRVLYPGTGATGQEGKA